MAADVGGLQRFPKIVGNDSLVRELMLSGRKMKAEEAAKAGILHWCEGCAWVCSVEHPAMHSR